MTFLDDIAAGRYLPRASLTTQSGTSIDNLHTVTAVDAQPTDFGMSLTMVPTVLAATKYGTSFNTFQALSCLQNPNGEIALVVNTQGAALTDAAPATYAASQTDGVALAANAARRWAIIVNGDTVNTVWIAFGQAAVATTGIPIFPGGSYEMSVAAGNLRLTAVHAICNTGLTATVGVQEAT